MIPAIKLQKPLSFGFGVEVWLGNLGDHTVVVRRYFGPALEPRFGVLPDASAIMRLNHPGLQRMMWNGVDEDGTLVQVSDWVEGASLKSIMRNPDRLEMTFFDFRRLLRDGLSALAYLHDHAPVPLIHGDISPGNMIVGTSGDAGGARMTLIDLKCPITRSGSKHPRRAAEPDVIVGTLPYMADEVLTGAPLDPRAEVWSLAVSMLAAAIGQTPWPAADSPQAMLHLRREFPASSLLAQVPRTIVQDRGLSELLEGMIEQAPGDRPTARQAAERL